MAKQKSSEPPLWPRNIDSLAAAAARIAGQVKRGGAPGCFPLRPCMC